jgi:hypothetical protein
VDLTTQLMIIVLKSHPEWMYEGGLGYIGVAGKTIGADKLCPYLQHVLTL